VDTRTLPHRENASLACGAPTVRLGNVTLELPSLAATHADYEKASNAKVVLKADIFNYRYQDYKRPIHTETAQGHKRPINTKTAQDNAAKRIRDTQKAHKPKATIVHMIHDGSLTTKSLLEFYEFQKGLDIPIITTTEKNPRQGASEFIEEMGAFEDFETSQAKAPTVSIMCDPENLEEKLRYIAGRYKIVNVQWAGYGDHIQTWEVLSRFQRNGRLWCNTIGIERAYETIKDGNENIHPASVIPPLMFGAHSYSVMPRTYPRDGGGAAGSAPKQGRVMRFDPSTCCYIESKLDVDVARARSFNSIQEMLGLVRSGILDGSFYSRYCAKRQGLRACLEQAMNRSGTSREPGQTGLFDQ